MKAIMFTAHSKAVAVCYPFDSIFRIMQSGGWWSGFPKGYINVQIERWIKEGVAPDHAKRYCEALGHGGVVGHEAWAIIRDHNCARHGTNHDLIDTDELPDSYWWDAWRRSDNGGPAYVDLKKAQQIQWQNMCAATDAENKRRERDLFGKPPIKLDRLYWRNAILHARDEKELRKVWPEQLPPW